MTTATKSSIELLAEDLRQKGLIPLGNVLTIEVHRHEHSEGCRDRQHAWWHAPFGTELRRFAADS